MSCWTPMCMLMCDHPCACARRRKCTCSPPRACARACASPLADVHARVRQGDKDRTLSHARRQHRHSQRASDTLGVLQRAGGHAPWSSWTLRPKSPKRMRRRCARRFSRAKTMHLLRKVRVQRARRTASRSPSCSRRMRTNSCSSVVGTRTLFSEPCASSVRIDPSAVTRTGRRSEYAASCAAATRQLCPKPPTRTHTRTRARTRTHMHTRAHGHTGADRKQGGGGGAYV